MGMACLLYICLFALLATVYSQMMTMDQPACPPNEMYHWCVGAVCHKTCDDMNYPPPGCSSLSSPCVPGCVCEMGFLRNKQGVCVRTFDCEAPVYSFNDPGAFECPQNEKYYRCSRDVCHKTCQDMKFPPTCPELKLGCVEPACLCDVGYLRNEVGMCIPLHECPL